MPLKNRRSAAVSRCIRCDAKFHPFRGREQTQRYCSLACSRAVGIEAMRRGGKGGRPRKNHAAPTRRARVSTTNVTGVAATSPSSPPVTPITPVTPARSGGETANTFDQDWIGREWRESAERYERLTARLAERERRRGSRRTLILAGYGARLSVERDALIVQEGHTHNPQQPARHVLYRGVHDVERIVWLDASGSLSFHAVEWCHEQGICVSLLNGYGDLLSTITPEHPADVKLRRAQYLAQATGRDVEIAREILRRKLRGQWLTIAAHPELPDEPRAREALRMALSWLSLEEQPPWLQSLDMLRTYEGRTARAYFAAWVGMPLRWAKPDAKRVPPHWLSVRARTSPLAPNGNGRHAVDPANAILNYAYAMLESQCRQALTSRGFDLVCGFLHADKAGRDSLVYDLMECERGAVDRLALDFLSRTTFHARDFTRVLDGSCRLHPQLARAVVASCRISQTTLNEHGRWLASALVTKSNVSPNSQEESEVAEIVLG